MSINTATADAEALKDRLNYLEGRRETMLAEDWPAHKVESITARIDEIEAELAEREKTRLLPGFPGYSDRAEAQEGSQ